MSRRITISEDQGQGQGYDDDDDDDVILRSGSLRRLRALRYRHYWGTQRASGDRLPLIPNSQRAAIAPLPPPPPTYQPQPHQLIAVCFNHMAGRQCEHCQRLNKEYGGNERLESSPDSGHSSGHQNPQQQQRSSRSDSEQDEKPQDGGEKGGDGEPPAPAGFWDKRLSKLRLEIFGEWAKTSQSFES